MGRPIELHPCLTNFSINLGNTHNEDKLRKTVKPRYTLKLLITSEHCKPFPFVSVQRRRQWPTIATNQ